MSFGLLFVVRCSCLVCVVCCRCCWLFRVVWCLGLFPTVADLLLLVGFLFVRSLSLFVRCWSAVVVLLSCVYWCSCCVV